MKIPEQEGFYKYYDGTTNEKIIVKFVNGLIFIFEEESGFSPEDEDEEGSYFLEPIEPIKFD